MSKTHIRIEKMAFGGSGIGYLSGKVCFVPFTAPGDTADIRIVADKRSYATAEVINIVERSRIRVHPPCPVFGSCGGCNWQHIDYSSQVDAKLDIFSDLLWRSGRVPRELIEPALAAPEPYGYRSRIQLKVQVFSGQMHLGFYRAGTHSIVDVPEQCLISSRAVNQRIAILRNFLPVLPGVENISQVDIATGDDGKAIVVFRDTGNPPKELIKALNRSGVFGDDGLYLQSGRKNTMLHISGPESLSYRIPSGVLSDRPRMNLTFAAGSFSQVNYLQNQGLIATVRAWAGLKGKEKLLDLYCGNGNLSLPLADSVGSIVCVEDHGPSISDAIRNCGLNGLSNVACEGIDAVAGVHRLMRSGDEFDVVILDPPRAGAADLVRHVPGLRPAKVIYVSCDPATLARDVGILRKLGYKVTRSKPVDMFPQTYHIESVTLFEAE